MKKLFIVFFCVLSLLSWGQSPKAISYYDYPALAKYNLSYLDKKGSISSRVRIREHVFELVNRSGATEVWIPWNGMAHVIERLELGNHHDMYNGYNKTIKDLSGGRPGKLPQEYHPVPVTFQELTIAVDPGHFAANFKEAIREQKYVKIHGSDVGLKDDVSYYEAYLNDVTAMLLVMEIEKRGAKAVLTKAIGKNSLGISFHDWYKTDLRGRSQFKIDLEKAKIAGDIDHKYYENELKSDSVGVFNHFFRFIEFRKRIDFINTINPSLTIALHYNAKEGGKRDSLGFLKPVKENYSMVFVPGAFLSNELNRQSEMLDFLRLITSSDLDKSMRLGHLILQEEQNTMGIPPVSAKDHVLDDQSCNPTIYEGVYCRNLALTRTIRGPIVYLEALLQDNEEEVKNLSVNDLEIDHPQYGKMKVPKRCAQVANSIVKGIEDWLEENKSYLASVAVEQPIKN